MIVLVLFSLGLAGIWLGWAWQVWATLLLVALAVEHVSS